MGIHLAVLVEPYLQFILDGRKTVESRFGVHRAAPHGTVQSGDLVFLKQSSGPVVAACRIGKIWSFDLQATAIRSVRERFARELCAEDAEFWRARAHATIATLMQVDRVALLPEIRVEKKDRRGWVTIKRATQQLSLM